MPGRSPSRQGSHAKRSTPTPTLRRWLVLALLSSLLLVALVDAATPSKAPPASAAAADQHAAPADIEAASSDDSAAAMESELQASGVESSTDKLGSSSDSASSKGAKRRSGISSEEAEAIKQLHSMLDKDNDGSINMLESTKFLSGDDAKGMGRVWQARQQAFHKLDTDRDDNDFISVSELTTGWAHSPVRSWTTEGVTKWLVEKVQLPQYAAAFRRNNVDGKKLPFMAMNNGYYLRQNIGVTDHEHLNRLINQITLDVVFGGIPDDRNIYKEVALYGLLIALPILLALYFRSHAQSTAQNQRLRQMGESLTKAQLAADDFEKRMSETTAVHGKSVQEIFNQKQALEAKLQREIDDAKREAARLQTSRENSDQLEKRLNFAERELDQVRDALRRAEQQLLAQNERVQSDELRILLQRTFAIEMQQHTIRRQSAELELKAAHEALENVTRKNKNFMGSFRVAHGGSLDSLNDAVHSALQTLSHMRKESEEMSLRWQQIEDVLSVTVRDHSGLTTGMNSNGSNGIPRVVSNNVLDNLSSGVNTAFLSKTATMTSLGSRTGRISPSS
ncbi:hypothetical protein CAOG_00133 [Capsaspora owczarzaki ATCC 30864]|uniref:SAM domain-containing protein n=1 Tax=Capsaspora owczarzaki (strain ATCC 30864) TaxID=595528 RepID=A0A0D2X057_CAPO3|nr:hypothetical protein CAOG_00133 [Capsaspora owczarzaki ATCC 30864]KJE88479.1 hypothetical protein CAOG_000133 [Capsaspora owczarzaki ATCC 30864]|eukprot:XP_004365004.1 hypothetical protein CAOG_00133 [Capsaspora owczarzaki ATCC 30864]